MNRFVNCIRWIERRLTEIEVVVLAGLVVGILCLTFMQVVCRYILDSPLIWTEEFVLYLFVWIVMVGAAGALRLHEHFALTTFVRNLSPRMSSILSVVVDAGAAAFALVLLVQGSEMAAKGFSEEAASFQMRMGWFYLAVPVGGALMLWHVFARTVLLFCGVKVHEAPAAETSIAIG